MNFYFRARRVVSGFCTRLTFNPKTCMPQQVHTGARVKVRRLVCFFLPGGAEQSTPFCCRFSDPESAKPYQPQTLNPNQTFQMSVLLEGIPSFKERPKAP